MQVAMTAADKPLSLALFDEGEFRAELVAQVLNIGADTQAPRLSDRPAQRIFEVRSHLLKRLRKTAIFAFRGMAMEMLHGLGEVHHQFSGQTALAGYFV